MTDLDRRFVADEIEVRSEGEMRTVTGYAAVYNSRSKDLGGFREIIAPGAFADIAESKTEVRAYFNHDPNYVLGTTMSGTLRLSDTPKGLKYSIDLPSTSYARDLEQLIRRGDVQGSSFAFQVKDEEWRDGGRTRELRSLVVHDVSIVTNPAYSAAKVISMRSMDEFKKHCRDWKKQLWIWEQELYLMKLNDGYGKY